MNLFRVDVTVHFGGTLIVDEPFYVRAENMKEARKIAANDALVKTEKKRSSVSIRTRVKFYQV